MVSGASSDTQIRGQPQCQWFRDSGLFEHMMLRDPLFMLVGFDSCVKELLGTQWVPQPLPDPMLLPSVNKLQSSNYF